MPRSESRTSVSRDTRSGFPSRVDPAPSAALHNRPDSGSITAPATDTPSCTAASEIAYQGSP